MKSLTQYIIEGMGYDFDMNPDNLIEVNGKAKETLQGIEGIVAKHGKENEMKVYGVVEYDKGGKRYPPYMIVCITGGKNGKGILSSYEESITKIAKDIEKKHHCWMVQNINDCPDDVFSLFIGVNY